MRPELWDWDFDGDEISAYLVGNATLLVEEFYLGPSGTGANFHVHTSAMNVLVAGAKLWALAPPGRAFVTSMPLARYLRTRNRRRRAEDDGLLFCVQQPGDAVFVPSQWAHATTNLGELNVGIAVEYLSVHEMGPGFFSKES